MDVSKNSGNPQIIHFNRGFSIINHPFWGYPYFWKHPYNYHKSASIELNLQGFRMATC